MRRAPAWVVLLPLVLLPGCGDDDREPQARTTTVTVYGTNRPLAELCPVAEGLMIAFEDDLSASEAGLAADLRALAARGDRKAAKAVRRLAAAVEAAAATAVSGTAMEIAYAEAAVERAFGALSRRCRAAGASPFY